MAVYFRRSLLVGGLAGCCRTGRAGFSRGVSVADVAGAALLTGERDRQRQTARGKRRERKREKRESLLMPQHSSRLCAAGTTSRSLGRGPAAWASRKSAASAASETCVPISGGL